MNSYNTTLESKSIEESLPLSKGVGNLCLVELQPQSRLVHTNYNLTYNLRELILSLLRTIALLKLFRLVCGFEQKPLLVTTLILLSPKVSNQTDNGFTIYIISDNKCKNNFLFVFIVVIWLY